mmetsp:Transcript_5907/g.11532  ORF Transcript_5907/g.11532 Transcript_5907/m.11532 type:complete len:114 (-) Transcript_5907:1433-1774(-)
MSKKNNRKLRHQAHQYALRKEKEEREKQQKKIERKKQNEETLNIMKKLEIDSNRKPQAVSKLGATVSKKKTKRKGVRLRKNTVVRGIKIKDAESKKRVKEILAAEETMRDMAE